MKIRKIPDLDGTNWKVVSVCDEQDKSEIENLIEAHAKQHRTSVARLTYILDRVSQLGPRRLNPDIVHEFGNGIRHFRAHDIRVMWFYDEGQVVVCAHGFVKKTKKTKPEDIDKAKEVKDKYFEAKKNGTLEELIDEEE